MAAQMTTEEVWRIFEGASGCPRERYRLEKVEGGWVIRWADRASMPMGMAPWVVTDGGEAFRVGFPNSLKPVLAELAERRNP